ncbi:MAG: flavodoxin family protein, partial [Clostridia bacterium]|nr:flavodoxin family protein [Clostridia bacterium]
KTQKCVLKDDAVEIAEKVKNSDTLVFVTPIYYYEMSGQMKTLLDRLNPLYSSDYKFRKVYMLSVAAEDEKTTPEKAVNGLQGWVDCFEKAELAGSLFCGGINDAGEASSHPVELEEAYEFGKTLE